MHQPLDMRDLAARLGWLLGLTAVLLLSLELVAAWSQRTRRRHLRRWLEAQGAEYPRRP